MKKRCIFLISARKNLLKDYLFLLDKNYKKDFKYPVLIFYLGKIYDDLNFRNSIRSINNKIEYRFHKLRQKIPSHLKNYLLILNYYINY